MTFDAVASLVDGSRSRSRRVVVVCLLLGLLGSAAGKTLNVYAASSLTEALTDIAALYEQAHPNVDVTLNFAGSSTLALQIVEGAPADVFASADSVQLSRVAEAGLVTEAGVVFAGNRLVVATGPESDVTEFTDIGRAGVDLILAGPEVPAGRYAREALAAVAAAGRDGFLEDVLSNLVSEEPNVRLVAVKVALGEVDAGIVYATDAAAFEELSVIELPPGVGQMPTYVVAVLRDASDDDLAAAFVSLLTSVEGRAALRSHGFTTPGD